MADRVRGIGHAGYDCLQAMESSYWRLPEPYRYDWSLAGSADDSAGYVQVKEYRIVSAGAAADVNAAAEAIAGMALCGGAFFARAHE